MLVNGMEVLSYFLTLEVVATDTGLATPSLWGR